jgi:NAD(P)-dependent dehydrogenase (short-subunit alcohol dehydrogenase family)
MSLEHVRTGRTTLITGASRGLGQALAEHRHRAGDALYLVARQPSREGLLAEATWIATDLARSSLAVDAIAHAIGTTPLDAIIANVGIWESHAFSDAYSFQHAIDDETARILTVNVATSIMLIKRLLPNLQASDNPKIIVIGSVSGLENSGTKEVAFAASNFAKRGMVHALRESLRADRIGVTIIEPGYMATPEVLSDLGPEDAHRAIPLDDIATLVDAVLRMSRRTNVKQIVVPAMMDEFA